MDRGLPECPLGLFQKAHSLGLLDALDKPRLGAMAAMVVLGEDRIDGVLAFEHARGMRDTSDHGDTVGAGGCNEVAAGLLLEQIVDHLHCVDWAIVCDPDTLVVPANRGPE